jgi:hypothetical protein
MAVITATTAAANISTIAGGIIVFGEPLGASAPRAVMRLGAFLLVVAGAALMPGPVRAAEAGAQEERTDARQRRHREAARTHEPSGHRAR